MHSYDSDDYDDATYFQLQPKRVLPQQQVMRMLFETSADRKKLRTSRIRKVSTVAGPDVHKLDSQLSLLHSHCKVPCFILFSHFAHMVAEGAGG